MDLIINERTCRICLNQQAVNNLFTTENETIFSYSDMLSDIIMTEVYNDDGFPDKICQACLIELPAAHGFKQKASESHAKLSKHLKMLNIATLNETNNDCTDVKLKTESIEDGVGSNIESSNYYASADLDLKDLPIKKEESLDANTIAVGAIILECLTSELVLKPKKRKLLKNRKKITDKLKQKEKENIQSETLVVCDFCGKLVRNIKVHAKIHGEKIKKYSCGDCAKIFVSTQSRSKHRNTHHLGKTFFCEICKKDFKHKWNHMRIKHSTEPRTHSCILCKKSYFTANQLNMHMRFHTKEKPWKCELCERGFISQSQKNYHKRSVHEKEKNVICQYCSKGFFFNSELKKHISRVHLLEKKHKCEVCERMFASSSTLKMHLKIHRGIKDFSCNLCSKTIVSSGNLKIHMITHTKEKKYPCKYCGRKFGRAHHRDNHQKTACKHVNKREVSGDK